MSSGYQLVMRAGPNPGQVFELDKTEMYVGRDLSCEIMVNDSEVSRKHAKIYVFGQGFVIEDLGSTNGTFVNGQRISGPHSMIPGELISFGDKTSFTFQVEERDEDATRVAAPTPAFVPAPSVPPQSSPGERISQQPPQPSYAGHVPSSPIEPVKPPKKKRRVWLILLILFVLFLCACIVFFVAVDQFNWYCDLFPGIMNSVFGAGTCP